MESILALSLSMEPGGMVVPWEMIRPSLWAGMALWCLGLMWGFSPLHRRLQSSWEQRIPFDPTGALASLLSLTPFLLGSILVVALTELSLGKSWGVSCGLIACVSGGLYELGRRDITRGSSAEEEP
ncbi:hypothetical protein [Thermostichus vulcanus]|nr:hypothetical protein [Thermostichus vulcanus]